MFYVIVYYISSLVVLSQGFRNPSILHRAHGNEEKSPGIRVVYEAAGSSCYTEGRATQCMPPFTNVAEGAVIKTTSTCGVEDKNEKFCSHRMDHTGRSQTHCELCSPPDKFQVQHLIDRHQMNNETVWVSGNVAPGGTVNLTVSLGKAFEVHYISLRPYDRLPDAIALYKSADFGKTWQPWQYFSTDCYRAFRLPTSNERNAQISAANIQEVLCVALKAPETLDSLTNPSKVIAFSTVIGRSSSHTWSSALIDWMTMTDLRVSLSRFASPQDSVQHDVNGLLMASNLLTPANIFRVGDVDRMKISSGTVRLTKHHIQSDAASTTEEDNRVQFALSDLAIGGRCKCNGHANRCVRDPQLSQSEDKKKVSTEEWGPLRCECQHNTAGTDCEHCAPSYLDRPWARATAESANECKRCDCNLHSNTCVFSEQIYLMSLKTSGGVCQHCQHNTVGRKCHQCASDYYRDWTKPLSHDQVCLECHCHSIGSVPNKPCDRKTGQCACKPGVVGQTCDRCQDGYRQTNLSEQPCVRAIEHFAYRRRNAPSAPSHAMTHDAMVQETSPQCPPCRPHKKRVRFRTFCRREAVFLGTIQSHKFENDKIRLEVRIQDTWRVDGAAGRLVPKKASANLPPFPVWIGSHDVGSSNGRGQRVRCFCPELKVGETYLFLTDSFQVPHGNRMELMLNTNSMVLPWRESWRRRLNKFVRRATKGRCNTQSPQSDTIEPDVNRFRRVQRLRTAPGFYSGSRWIGNNGNAYKPHDLSEVDQQSFSRVQQSNPPNQRTFYHMVSDQSTSGHPKYPKQPQFTYYNPYMERKLVQK